MTITDYREECEATLDGIPPRSNAMDDYFMILRLNELYRLATEGSKEESRECLKHWLSLPVEEGLKREVIEAWKRKKQ
jgi:hypothetical protein